MTTFNLKESFPDLFDLFEKWWKISKGSSYIDFLDDQEIYIDIQPYFRDDEIRFDFEILEVNDKHTNEAIYFTREEAKKAAIYNAFEILENKLSL